MTVDLAAAKFFVHDTARVLDRHRFAALVEGDDGAAARAVAALAAYRNADGGFGHALEPDLRVPESQPSATQYALEMLLELGHAADHPFVGEALDWVASIADDDGSVNFVLPFGDGSPVGPWWHPHPGSFLTTGLAASAHALGVTGNAWVDRATEWSLSRIQRLDDEDGMNLAYWILYAVQFLDRLPDAHDRTAVELLERLRPVIDDEATPIATTAGRHDGNEHLGVLELSPLPGTRSRRVLFDDETVDGFLGELEAGQQDDGGWTFDWDKWSPGATLEWRGNLTVRALRLLRAHDRLRVAAAR